MLIENMTCDQTPVERLKNLANLLELALHAPEGEVTYDGRVALQSAACQIVALSGEILNSDNPS